MDKWNRRGDRKRIALFGIDTGIPPEQREIFRYDEILRLVP
jgi:hypothetical protein